MTRARKRLLLSHARFRRIQGVLLPHPPSRFIDEIPDKLIDEVSPPAGFFPAESTGWDSGPSWGASGSSAAQAARRRRAAPPPPPPKHAATVQHEDGYDVGVQVSHPRFGGGRILDREGQGKQLKLTIHFSSHGSKKILPAYTSLEIG